MKSVCVYCGSSPGAQPAYHDAAVALGRAIANAGCTLVYGGASVGLMGAVADAALSSGGDVVGVLPTFLKRVELEHTSLSELIVVEDMHERKATMAARSDAFIAMPGGLGTLEELFEMWTWTQLSLQRKPMGLLNVAGYYDGLLAFLDHATAEGFVRETHRALLVVDDDGERLISRLSG